MRLKFNPRARALLRRLPAVNVYSLGELVLLAVLAVQCARLFYAMVTPLGPLGDWRIAPAGVGGAPGSILSTIDPFFRVSGAGAPATTVTSLQLTLYGTRLDDASGQASAIIAGPDGVQNSVGVGEEIVPGVRLKAVAFDHVTIERGGVPEELYIDQSGGPASANPASAPAPGVPNTRAVDPGTVTASQVRSDIAFSPRIADGRIAGLIVHPQGNGTAFHSIGLRDGDVITVAGGVQLNGPADVERALAGLKPGSDLMITVERGQQTLPLAVTIRGQ
ncbi:MAG: PDZ domain-containing protein [Sphingomonas sp.]|uniref:type II secretion system protein N n=1 Tax=Sphingomonas sp. TaxID=28214 RepID=UPI001AC04D16|nr:type II secretion system protein N [Sphingomonas sp.]MBN8807724.1 PDZ domain-containing protein [Sphingomonas sp.]